MAVTTATKAEHIMDRRDTRSRRFARNAPSPSLARDAGGHRRLTGVRGLNDGNLVEVLARPGGGEIEHDIVRTLCLRVHLHLETFVVPAMHHGRRTRVNREFCIGRVEPVANQDHWYNLT